MDGLKELEIKRVSERLADVFGNIVQDILLDTRHTPTQRVERLGRAVKELEQVVAERLSRRPGRPLKEADAAEDDPFIMPYIRLLQRRPLGQKELTALKALAASTDPAERALGDVLAGRVIHE